MWYMSEEFLKPCNEIQFFNPSISDFFKITCHNLFHHKNIRFHVYPLEKKASGKKKSYLSVILFRESIEKRKINEIQTNLLMEYEM